MQSPAPIAVVTGSSGFIGRFIVQLLLASGWHVRAASRFGAPAGAADAVALGDIAELSCWKPIIQGAQVVVHCAGRAHRRKALQEEERELYAAINTLATERLAQDCLESGVRDLIFLSTIAVHGSHTDDRAAFSAADALRPQSVYSETKARAEDAIMRVLRSGGMSAAILRPPAVLGQGAPNNLPLLGRLVLTGLPLPFGMIRNRRMFIGIDSLASFILRRVNTATHAGIDIFPLADEPKLSTGMLCRVMATARGVRYREFPFPPEVLRRGLTLAGRADHADALIASLEIDTGAAAATGWRPAPDLSAAIGASIQSVGSN
jgi:UDP-glucose 4-epimerase